MSKSKKSSQIKSPARSDVSEYSDLSNTSNISNSSTNENQMHRRKPQKKSRMQHNIDSFDTDFKITKHSNLSPKECDECIVKDTDQIKLQAKIHEVDKQYKKLQTSYMHIETEMIMIYVLFFTLAPYLLYAGIKYDNRVLVSIGIILLLYTATNVFLFMTD